MKYNFDEYVCRKGSCSYKWDSPDSGKVTYPLWVADMDFRAPEAILNALHERVNHGVFGYVTIPQSMSESVCRWFERRHGWTIDPARIETTSGVVSAVTAILRTMVAQGRKRVVLNAPSYNCFYACVAHAGCELTQSHLLLSDRYYTYDWTDMESKLSCADIFILCNPHNPTGRIWSKEELEKIANLCRKYDVFVIADEIHCEFEWPNGPRYTPFASVAKDVHYVIMTSATKAFNIAGLQIANLISSDDCTQALLCQALAKNHLEDINPFGLVAAQAAYNECEDWVNEMNAYIQGNYEALCEWFAQNAPEYPVTRMDGTYLAWIDCRAIQCSTEDLCRRLVDEASVKFNPGAMYGDVGFIRINLACTRSLLLDALTHSLPILKKVL